MTESLQESIKVAKCSFNAQIPILTHAKIKEHSAKTNLSQNEILRRALEMYFESVSEE